VAPMMSSKYSSKIPVAAQFEGSISDELSKHVLGVRVGLQKGVEQTTYVFSAVIVLMEGVWILVTAGHCLDDIDAAVTSGYSVASFGLIDGTNSEAKDHHIVPISYTASKPKSFFKNEDHATDIGLIVLDTLTTENLRKNGMLPIPAGAWGAPLKSVDFYILSGLPDEYVTEMTSVTLSTMVFLEVNEVADRPEAFDKSDGAVFYGELNRPDELKSIVGMSGGPIFAFRKIADGWQYSLHAIQSTWDKSRYLAAPIFGPHGRRLLHLFHSKFKSPG
jgi:hypothetical protein